MGRHQSGFTWVIVLVILALAVLLGGVYFYVNREANVSDQDIETAEDNQAVLPSNQTGNGNESEPVFCTADAKQCPDGSYVGRTGPNCEFVCPGDNFDSKD